MQSFINRHQLNQIFDYISKEFKTFATQKINGKVTFAEYKKSLIPIPTPKTIMSFKKYLWPDNQSLGSPLPATKLAFIGLTNCDAIALNKFLNEFSHTNLLPKRENILIISTECQSDEFCFCTALGYDKIQLFDLYIQSEKDSYSIFSGSKTGEKVLKENGVKNHIKKPKLRNIILETQTKINKNNLCSAINDLANFKDFWQKIANNCFGCGSCSTVCPLCFCISHQQKNKLDGSCTSCLSWDSCFAKNFSEIQNHHDLRPERINRLYNWYHHKFTRAYLDKKDFLCTGCGRCIKACPAHLNQYKIISSVENQENKLHG